MRYLIAGLGNIGQEYQNTRHNIGFDILNTFCDKEQFVFESSRLAFIAKGRIKNKLLFFIQPTTYMNNSGKAVRYWLNELKIPKENLLVVADDIALPFGKIRMRQKGSPGGHNGIASIVEYLGTDNFPRLRFGIGDHFSKGKQVDYVLSTWTPDEQAELPLFIDKSTQAIKDFALQGINRAMSIHNAK